MTIIGENACSQVSLTRHKFRINSELKYNFVA